MALLWFVLGLSNTLAYYDITLHFHDFGNRMGPLRRGGWSAGYYQSSGRKYHFTAVPQCPFPDAAMGSFLAARGNLFTYILVQVR